MEAKLEEIINRSIDRLNDLLPTGDSLPKEKSVILLGGNAALDSMGFVNLVVAVEEELDASLGIKIVLADRITAQDAANFTIGDLQRLLANVVAER
jgi:acyl carrier protein